MGTESVARAKTKLDQSAERFYQSGEKYLAALDAWIEARADELKHSGGESSIRSELKDLRTHREEAEELLRRLFPDEFADTCSAAE